VAGRIFISYRRGDTASQAGWLFDRLAGQFGPHQVIKDVDPARVGPDLAEGIAAVVASCDVLVALIGRQWLTAAGQDGRRLLYDPGDSVRLEIESALTRGVRVVPLLIDGAQLPQVGDLPLSLAGLVRPQALELGPGRADADLARLIQVLDQPLAESQATQAGQLTITSQPPAALHPSPRPEKVPPSSDHSAPGHTKHMRRRRFQTRTIAAIASGAIVAAAIAAFLAVPRSHPTPSSSSAAGAHHQSLSKSGPSASPGSSGSPGASAKVIVTDDFSTKRLNWVDDFHPTAGAYTGNGTYRLSVTGADGQSEVARPDGDTHGLAGATSMNLSLSVDARKIAGAAQGYGYGLALRSDSSGDFYAFVIQDHAVAIQKWVDSGARVADSPDPVTTDAVHVNAADRLQAVCTTADGGQAVHLELWLNGKKLVDFTDRDHPYTKGYLGLYVQSISDTSSTAAAEFGNFSASQL
jgi:hypothetical protein